MHKVNADGEKKIRSGCNICCSVITNYRTTFNGNQYQTKKENSYFHFKFKLFWAAIFLTMLFYCTYFVHYHYVCVCVYMWDTYALSFSCVHMRVHCPTHRMNEWYLAQCSLTLLRHIDILLFLFFFFFLSLASAIFHWNYGWIARMDGTRKCRNAYRHCIIIIITIIVYAIDSMVCGVGFYWCKMRWTAKEMLLFVRFVFFFFALRKWQRMIFLVSLL